METYKKDVPFKSFIKKGRTTSEVLELCKKECERQIEREAKVLLKILDNYDGG